MKFIKEVKDSNLLEESDLKLREASRAILFDENNLIPLLFVSKYNYHKLPGGGINKGEDKKQALFRECLEEIGCEIEVEGEVGKIIEFRARWNLKQTSYCYFGKILSKGKSSFTKKELVQGFEVVWTTLDNAITKIENDNSDSYESGFIKQRDLAFLVKFKEVII